MQVNICICLGSACRNIATSLLIPLEIYELVKHASVGKVIVLIINIAVVVYLIYRLKYDPKHKQIHGASAKAHG